MFSIADIQVDQEADFEEPEEGEEASEDHPAHSYPIRCSFAITKVCQVTGNSMRWY
jgi:complement component 1 Q subcomponent-binding protein, mitochondrial